MASRHSLHKRSRTFTDSETETTADTAVTAEAERAMEGTSTSATAAVLLHSAIEDHLADAQAKRRKQEVTKGEEGDTSSQTVVAVTAAAAAASTSSTSANALCLHSLPDAVLLSLANLFLLDYEALSLALTCRTSFHALRPYKIAHLLDIQSALAHHSSSSPYRIGKVQRVRVHPVVIEEEKPKKRKKGSAAASAAAAAAAAPAEAEMPNTWGVERLPHTVTELTVAGYTAFYHEQIDVTPLLLHLPSTLRSLIIKGEIVQPSADSGFRLPPTLTQLTLDAGWNRLEQLSPLPSNLRSFTIADLGIKLADEFPAVNLPPLPPSLRSLRLNHWNGIAAEAPQRLQLPEGLEELHIDHYSGALANLQRSASLKKLSLNSHVEQSGLCLPPYLQSLQCGKFFSLEMAGVCLPSSLTEWHYLDPKHTFPRSLEQVQLPKGLRSLILPEKYKFPLPKLEHTSLRSLQLYSSAQWDISSLRFPPSLTTFIAPSDLRLTSALNSFLSSLIHLTHLDLSYCSSTVSEPVDLRSLTWPPQLQKLSFGALWQTSLTAAQWAPPSTLTDLRLPTGEVFWQRRRPGAKRLLFPPHLRVLHVGDVYFDRSVKYGQSTLEGIHFPSTLRILCLSFEFSKFGNNFHIAHLPPLPPQLEEIHFGELFNSPIASLQLPSSLRSLTFGQHFNQPLDEVRLPAGLQQFTLGSEKGSCFDQAPKHFPRLPSGLRVFTTSRNRMKYVLQELQLPPRCVLHVLAAGEV